MTHRAVFRATPGRRVRYRSTSSSAIERSRCRLKVPSLSSTPARIDRDLCGLRRREAGLADQRLQLVRRRVPHRIPRRKESRTREYVPNVLDLLGHPGQHDEDQVVERIIGVEVARLAIHHPEPAFRSPESDDHRSKSLSWIRSPSWRPAEAGGCSAPDPSQDNESCGKVRQEAGMSSHAGRGGVQGRLLCLSAFSGVGGLDLGLERAGFCTVGAIEADAAARRSLALNRPRLTYPEPHDVNEVARRLLPRDLGIHEGELALLAAGPPCQPFSKAAQWSQTGARGLHDHERTSCLHGLMALVRALSPPRAADRERTRIHERRRLGAAGDRGTPCGPEPSTGHPLQIVEQGVQRRRARGSATPQTCDRHGSA